MLNTKKEYESAANKAKLENMLLESQVKKNSMLDVDALGEQAFMKAAQGLPLSPQEAAALKVVDAKSQGFSANPATGDYYYKPPLSQRMGLGGAQEQPMQPPSGMGQGGGVSPYQAPSPSPNRRPPGLTNRGFQTFMDENTKADIDRLTTIKSDAKAAAAAKGAAQRMQTLQGDLGYTGFGATPLAWADKALTGIGMPGVISGSPASREGFAKESVQAWVSAVEPLKGALTEREGARFDAAVPTIKMTPDGIKMMNDLAIAMGKRAQEKSIFYQDWLQQNGTLYGADQSWEEYAESNPIIPESWGGGQNAQTDAPTYPMPPSLPMGEYTNELGPMGVPPSNMMDKASSDETLFNAKKAIRNGADPQAVRQRLVEAGIDPSRAGL